MRRNEEPVAGVFRGPRDSAGPAGDLRSGGRRGQRPAPNLAVFSEKLKDNAARCGEMRRDRRLWRP